MAVAVASTATWLADKAPSLLSYKGEGIMNCLSNGLSHTPAACIFFKLLWFTQCLSGKKIIRIKRVLNIHRSIFWTLGSLKWYTEKQNLGKKNST